MDRRAASNLGHWANGAEAYINLKNLSSRLRNLEKAGTGRGRGLYARPWKYRDIIYYSSLPREGERS